MSFRQDAEAVARSIHDFLNRGGDPAELVAHLRQEHRTLQQSLARGVIVPLIEGWAQDYRDDRYDLRNEGTVVWANDIVTSVPPPAMPFV